MSLLSHVDYMNNEFLQHSVELDAPFSVKECLVTSSNPSTSYLSGIEGTPRPVGYGENSWLSSIIVAMLVIIALNINHCRQLFKNFRHNLLGIRQRANAFDNKTTNELRTLFIIILLLCMSEGILLFSWGTSSGLVKEGVGALPMTMLLAAGSMGYYLWQLALYKVIGYAFADREATRHWISGFNSSQVLLSMLLIVPALMALFYSGMTKTMLVLSVLCYILARILFICKGFRIFFTNFGSLLYFILYLCAVEIIPILILRRLSIFLLRDLNNFL